MCSNVSFVPKEKFKGKGPEPHILVCDLISQKLFITSFYKSRFPHKPVNVSFIITDINNELTNSCGN